MKSFAIIAGFVIGSAVAAIVGMTIVLPMSARASRADLDSDVHRPLEAALQSIARTMDAGDCSKAAIQLRLLNRRFAEYRAGGAPASVWYQDVIAATRPAQ